MNKLIRNLSYTGARMNSTMQHVTSAVTAIVLALLVIVVAQWFMPASYWLDVRSIRVSDTVEGKAPAMLVDRSINQTFVGHWTVTVLAQGATGGFTSVCVASGTTDYQPDAQLPKMLDLDWWTWPVRCVLPVGQYVVRTVWQIPIFSGMFVKDIRTTSNIFNVT